MIYQVVMIFKWNVLVSLILACGSKVNQKNIFLLALRQSKAIMQRDKSLDLQSLKTQIQKIVDRQQTNKLQVLKARNSGKTSRKRGGQSELDSIASILQKQKPRNVDSFYFRSMLMQFLKDQKLQGIRQAEQKKMDLLASGSRYVSPVSKQIIRRGGTPTLPLFMRAVQLSRNKQKSLLIQRQAKGKEREQAERIQYEQALKQSQTYKRRQQRSATETWDSDSFYQEKQKWEQKRIQKICKRQQQKSKAEQVQLTFSPKLVAAQDTRDQRKFIERNEQFLRERVQRLNRLKEQLYERATCPQKIKH